MKKTQASAPPASRQYLTFVLEEHEYGLELLTIREIQAYSPVTPIPNVPPFVRGVMNLRGTVLPVVDLRMRFGMPPTECNKFTVVLIAIVGGKLIGLLVDAISDVLTVETERLRPAPDFGADVDSSFINSVFQNQDRLAVVLNLNTLLTEALVSSEREAA